MDSQHGWTGGAARLVRWSDQWLAKKNGQIGIKNSFFCDLPIYREPLDNVV